MNKRKSRADFDRHVGALRGGAAGGGGGAE